MRWSLFACRDDWGVDGAGMAIVVVDGDGGKVVVAVVVDIGRAGDGRRGRDGDRFWFCYKSCDPPALLGA